MSLDEGVSELIRRIYAGVHDAAVWDSALDEMLARTVSRVSLVSVVDTERREFSTARFYGADDGRFLDAVRDYHDHLWRDDPALAFGLRNPEAGFVSLSSLGGEGWAAQPYARWLGSEMRVGDCAVRYTPPIDGLILGMSLHPHGAGACHSPAALALFALLFGHVNQALRVAARPLALLDDVGACLLVDRRGVVRQVSDPAARLLALGDGLGVAARRLRAATRADTARIDAALRSALGALNDGGCGGALAVPRPSGKRPWLLTISPLPLPPPPFEAFRPAALVRIAGGDTAPDAAAIERWRALHGLTPAECRLAAAIVAGDGTVRAIAARLGIAYATARVQLASIFDKCGVQSQAQLVRLLGRAS